MVPVTDAPSAETPPTVSVLVVDDRKDKRDAMMAVLSDLPLRVVVATCGMEALRHLLHDSFAVILLDLVMPEMDGIELAGIIRSRKRHAHVPIIFYSAYRDQMITRTPEVYGLGAVDFLDAGVSANIIRTKVSVFADLHRKIEEVQRSAGERERLLLAEAARAEAERASAAKDHFMAMLSHELRTPLSPVLHTIELLLADYTEPADLRENLETIQRNVALEARLIDDLLDLTRVSRGKVHLQIENVDVHECVRSAVEICAAEMKEKQVTLSFDLTAKNSHVKADAARLKQVLWNLVRNAIKFTPPGGSVVISTADAEGDWLRLEVVDTGSGISPNFLPIIFDAFRQGARTTGGLGLGLAITRSLVELHGGHIEALSLGVGQGSTFRVALKRSGPIVVSTAPFFRPLEAESSPARLMARVLLLEDHQDTRSTLTKLLTRRGYVVESASDVRSGLELARARPFDIIVSDIGLPDGNGYDFLEQLGEARTAPAIALSGYGMDNDMSRSLKAGFVRHITKPVNFAELDTAIQALAARE
ncbi:MAG: response regulator [Verrucomicrobiota bacterium]